MYRLDDMEKRQSIRQKTNKTSSNGKNSLSIRNKKYEKLFKMRSESSSESSTNSSDSLESITSKQSDSSVASSSSSSDSSLSFTPQSTMLKSSSVLMPDNAMELIVQRLMSLKVSSLSAGLKSSPGCYPNGSYFGETGSEFSEELATTTRATAKSASHISHSIKHSGSHVSESDSVEATVKSRASTANSRDLSRAKKKMQLGVTPNASQSRKPQKSSPTKQTTCRALRTISGTSRNLIVKRKRRAKKYDEVLSPFKMYTITDDYPLNNNLALHPIPSESSHEMLTKNKLTQLKKASPLKPGRIPSLEEEHQEEIEEVISLSTDDEVVEFSNNWEHLNDDETSRKINKRYVFTKVV